MVRTTLAIVFAGTLATKVWLDRCSSAPHWPTALVLGPAIGFGGLSLLYFLWRLCGVASSAFGPVAWVLVAIALIGGGRHAVRNRSRIGAQGVRDLVPIALATTGIALLAAAVIFYARQMPHGTFDAVAIWTARARLLHLGDNLPQLLGLVQGGHPGLSLVAPRKSGGPIRHDRHPQPATGSGHRRHLRSGGGRRPGLECRAPRR